MALPLASKSSEGNRQSMDLKNEDDEGKKTNGVSFSTFHDRSAMEFKFPIPEVPMKVEAPNAKLKPDSVEQPKRNEDES